MATITGGGVHEILARAEHLRTGDVKVLATRVVVDETDDAIGGVGVVLEEPSELLTRIAGAVDDHRLPGRVVPRRSHHGAGDEPTGCHEDHRDEGHREGHNPGVGGGGVEGEQHRESGADAQRHDREERGFLERRDAVPSPVELGGEPDRDLQHHRGGRVDEDDLGLFAGEDEVVAGQHETQGGNRPGQGIPDRQAGPHQTDAITLAQPSLLTPGTSSAILSRSAGPTARPDSVPRPEKRAAW